MIKLLILLGLLLVCATNGHAYDNFKVFSNQTINLGQSEQNEVIQAITKYWERLAKDPTDIDSNLFFERWSLSKIVDPVTETITLRIKDIKTNQVFYQSFSNSKKLELKYSNNFKTNWSSVLSDEVSSIVNLVKDYAPYRVADEKVIPTGWGNNERRVIQQVMELEKKLIEHWAEIIDVNKLDEAEMAEWISNGKVQIKDNRIGSAELNMIDDRAFVRVTHLSSEIAFLIFNEPLDPSSKHFKLYVSRQHIDSGSSRTDGILGRDVVVITKDKQVEYNGFYNPENYKSYKKGKTLISTKWWEDYMRATYKKPDSSVVGFGAVCGLAQGALGLCVAGLNKMIDPTSDMTLVPATFSTIWGTAIGAFVSTYKNWINRGSKIMRTIKSSANSVIFAYGLVGMIHPDGFTALTVLDPSGLLLHAGILGNVWANNLAKVYWNDFARIREFSGISRKNFVMKLPFGKKWETKIAQSAVESQSIYLAPFTIRLLDLTGFTIGSFPMGKFLLWSSIPAVEYAVLKYIEKIAKHTNHPKAVELAHEHRKHWEFKKLFLKDSKLRKIILKKIYFKLTFQKTNANRMHNLLARIYPEHYKKEIINKSSKQYNPKMYLFDVPNEKLPQEKSFRHTCKSILKILFAK